jgi:hypothetical protein
MIDSEIVLILVLLVSVLVKTDDLPELNRLVNQLMDQAQLEQTVDDNDES